MRAVVIHAPEDLRIDAQDDAAAPGPGEVRVAIARGGICGSDLHYFHHGGFGTVRIREPMVLGHEVSGVIADTGAGVEGLAPGDKVAVSPSMPCGRCDYCQRGMRNHCTDMRFAGSAMRFPHQQGFFREALTLPATQVIRLRPQTDLGHAACAEPFAVCLHAAMQAGPLLGRRVLVAGCGPIGCLTVLAAARAGAAEIIATDLMPAPLAIAARMGATRTIDLSADAEALAPLAAGKGTIDVSFECSGSAKAMQSACAVTRPGGTIIAVGLGGDAPMPLGQIVTKELRIAGSFRFDREFAMAADLIDRGLVDLSPLVSDVLPMAEAPAAFALASDRARAMKVQLEFGAA